MNCGNNSDRPSSRRMHRRDFLKGTVAATATAMALPNIVSAAVLGRGGKTAPSERITLGLIGMGRMMAGHFGSMLGRSDVQILALSDVETNRLAMYKQRAEEGYAQRNGMGAYKGCDAYNDFRNLVTRDDIDAVMIATPEHWHAIPAVMAMRSGKDVYCEKPLALTLEEGKVMVKTARQYSRVFQTGSQQRSSKEFRLACELVRNGRIGKLHTIHITIGGPSQECYLPAQPVPEGLDWDTWIGPSPWRPYNQELAPPHGADGWPNWRSYRDFAGGMMTDWGAHHFDIAQWGMGMDKSGPREIIPPDGKEQKHLEYRYDSGVSMFHGGGKSGRGVEFIGTEGRVIVDRGYLATDPEHLIREPITPEDIHLEDSPSHHQNWIDAIRARHRPICDVEVGHRSATVCHLGNIAFWLNRPLKWNPKTQQITNDSNAARMMSRAMRSPWTL